MEAALAEFLQLIWLTIWNVFPNGTMVFASWFSYQSPQIIIDELEEDGLLV